MRRSKERGYKVVVPAAVIGDLIALVESDIGSGCGGDLNLQAEYEILVERLEHALRLMEPKPRTK